MNRLIGIYCRFLNVLNAGLLLAILLLVFCNVVLRYGFNSGIMISEELSRWLFVWLTFLGALVALHEREHLGTDMLVARLGRRGRSICLGISQLGMLYVTWLLLCGSITQAKLNLDVPAPVTGTPIAVFYASGIVFGISALIVLGYAFLRLLSGRMSEAELVMVRESEDEPAAHESAPLQPREHSS